MTRKQFEICVAHRIYLLCESPQDKCIVDTNYAPKVGQDLVLCSHSIVHNSDNAIEYLRHKEHAGFCLERLSNLKPIALLPTSKSTSVKYIKKAYFNDRVEIRE